MTLRFFNNGLVQDETSAVEYYFDAGNLGYATDAMFVQAINHTASRGVSIAADKSSSYVRASVRREDDPEAARRCNAFIYAAGYTPADPEVLYTGNVPGESLLAMAGVAALPTTGDDVVILAAGAVHFCAPGLPTARVSLAAPFSSASRRALITTADGFYRVACVSGSALRISAPFSSGSAGPVGEEEWTTDSGGRWAHNLLAFVGDYLGDQLLKATCCVSCNTYASDFSTSCYGRVTLMAEWGGADIRLFSPGDWIYTTGAQAAGVIEPKVYRSVLIRGEGNLAEESGKTLVFTGIAGPIESLGADRLLVPPVVPLFWRNLVQAVEQP